ncbi:MAG: alginate O-acetyltransferase AlgX-related protein [Acidobacteriota bacterium]
MKRILTAVSAALLLLPLILPQGLALLGVSQGPKAVENRLKTPLPPLSLAGRDFKAFAKQLTTSYGETFPFRDDMIRTANRIKLALFNESPSKNVILGRDGWLFFNMESALEDWLGVNLLSPEELAAFSAEMKARRDWLAARGTALLLVIAPNKASVYGQFMPPAMHKLSPVTRLDQLAQAMREAGVPFLDLRPALASAGDVRRAYWKTDTHWNGWGAFRGSAAIVEALRARFPEMPPLADEEYHAIEFDTHGGDLSDMLLLTDTLTEHDIEMERLSPTRAHAAGPPGYPNPAMRSGRDMVVLETGDKALPKAVFFRDSFSSTAIPFLSQRFSRSVFLWEHTFQPQIIEAEKPDVVVIEAVERYLHQPFRPVPLP